MLGTDAVTDASPGRQARPRGIRELAAMILFLGLLAAAAGVVEVANQLTQPGGSVPIRLPNGGWSPEDAQLPEGLWFEPSSSLTVTLQVFELPAGLRALSETSALARGILLAAAGIVLRRVLLDIAAGQPFAPRMPTRMGVLAGLVLALGAIPATLDTAAATAVLRHSGLGGPSSQAAAAVPALPVDALLVAALLGVLVQVFRHGRWLTEDVQGLV